MDSLAFLSKANKAALEPIYVLAGDEDFLKRRVQAALVKRLLGAGDAVELGLANLTGDKADLLSVRTELDTLPFLCPRRVVLIEQADPFVTKFRAGLEKLFAAPSTSGVLILEVKTFPETTKLAKALSDAAKISCKAPTTDKLSKWCVEWALTQHSFKLELSAAQHLLDLIGPQMGQLDQELAKLATASGGQTVTPELVAQLVGRSRAGEVFKIFDAIAAGQAGPALKLLDRLFVQGEDAHAILGPMSWQLRKLAQVGRLLKDGVTLNAALDRAEVPNFPAARQTATRLVQHWGNHLERLHEWLLAVDLGLKGGSALAPRTLMERFIVQLAQPAKRQLTATSVK
jgi:DNA polymerase-3 subunit delta